MKDESFGVIPFCCRSQTPAILLVKHAAGHWSLPKGHAEENESNRGTVFREFQEETGSMDWKEFPDSTYTESYSFERGGEIYEKTVTYFLVQIDCDAQVTIQDGEILEYKWITLDKIDTIELFPSRKDLLLKAFSDITEIVGSNEIV